jgi:site-specific recombinase XerD
LLGKDAPGLSASNIARLKDVWKAGLVNVRLHDLRHSFASFAAANGASLYVIGKALGHTQPSTTARYAHLTNDPVRQMSEGVAAAIFATPASKQSDP